MSGRALPERKVTNFGAAPIRCRALAGRRHWRALVTGRATIAGLLLLGLLCAVAGFTGCEPLEQGATSQMVGKTAPLFRAARLDGGEVELADHLGKNIVILDFWATWCGPCVKAMPQIIKVAKEYRDRGVVLYAVNQGQDARTITEFLAEEKLNVDVLLDSDGSVGDRYAVSGIPETVIIGRDGKIQGIHVGFGPNLGKQLREELDRLLATQAPPDAVR